MKAERPKIESLNHYQIISAIGKGGMGEVFLAQDTRLDRKVALKILPPEFAEDFDRMSRFVREAKSASALNHPNIITIYEIGEADGNHYIATEFITGETLHRRLKHSRLELKLALDLMIQVSSALDAAHRAGIIHRDIKPENIMIRPDGLVKLLDFGVAKLTEEKESSGEDEATLAMSLQLPQSSTPPLFTSPGIVIGTATYMSPEQAKGKEIDARSDIFSFGIVFYEMLTGKRAFGGETALESISSILKDEPKPLSQILPEIPPEIERIVGKMLQKDREERYSSIAELLIDLRQSKQKLDYLELERAFSPEQPTAQMEIRQTDTAILEAASSDSGGAISTKSSQILPPNNLTAELSPLIGRENEVAEIVGLLSRNDIRLVTITGVGGTGKTRLSQAIAHESLLEFTDGIYFINLSAIESAELVMPTIAQTLGLREERGSTLQELLHEHLRERKILIVLDNFEQITSAASNIGKLLSATLNLKILVTSRIRLQLRFEKEFTLAPLQVPGKENLSLSQLNEYPAIELFVERAQAVKTNFALTKENAGFVAEICRKLDGLPLAIELAAVRVKLLAPQAILTRLSNSLKLLTGGARDLPERQQTMRATIAWSYDLLEAEEKTLLNRLAIFAGGFTLEGAEAVGENYELAITNDELKKSANQTSQSEIDILDGVASLVDKSLLLQREKEDGEPWFRMLVVVREFALEELESSGEADEIKRLHTEFYTRLAEIFEPQFDGANAAEWLENLEQEHDNIRAAIEWSLENQPENALAIVGAIRSFWNRRGHLSEASKWIRQALEKSGEAADPKLLAKAYCALGDSVWGQGDSDAAAQSYQESLRLARQIEDKFWISTALRGLGYIKRVQGDLSEAKLLIGESLELARELNDTRLISLRLNSLGEIARAEADYPTARKYYEEALTIAKKVSSAYLISIYNFNLAVVACLQGDYPAARLYALDSLKINEEMEDKIGIGDVLNLFAALAVKASDLEKAARLFGIAQTTYDAIGYKLEKVDQEFVNLFYNEAQGLMDQKDLETEFKKGQSMRLKDAIAIVRE